MSLRTLFGKRTDRGGEVFIFVGPSGSGKTALMEELSKQAEIVSVPSITTRERRDPVSDANYRFVSKREFLDEVNKGEMIEYSDYQGNYYGTSRNDLPLLGTGNRWIKAMDINGAVKIKHFLGDACRIIYIDRKKEDIIASIMQRDVPEEDKIRRIVSIDYEERNKEICGAVLYNHSTIEDLVSDAKKLIFS